MAVIENVLVSDIKFYEIARNGLNLAQLEWIHDSTSAQLKVFVIFRAHTNTKPKNTRQIV